MRRLRLHPSSGTPLCSRRLTPISGCAVTLVVSSSISPARATFATSSPPVSVTSSGWSTTDSLFSGRRDPGVSVVIETTEDPLFGPVVAFGLSGVAYDVMGDRAYAVPPLTAHDVQDLLDRPRAAGLLRHARSGHAVDRELLGDLVARVARLADDLPEVAHLVLRPVVASEHGLAVLGAAVTLRHPQSRTDLPARRLLG